MFIIIVAYRARGIQQFRRKQIIDSIHNFKTYFEQNNIEYKIVVTEQNNDNKFNRGLLLNAGFLECEKKYTFPKKYMHMNADYTFDLSRKFPEEMLTFEKGFLDLFRPVLGVLGAACLFDTESYNIINGFPNDLEGWGGDDWAIYNRIIQNNINHIMPDGLHNSKFIIEERDTFNKDSSNNDKNMGLAKRKDFEFNGLNSIKYTLDGYGEFHDGDTICHYLINDEFVV